MLHENDSHGLSTDENILRPAECQGKTKDCHLNNLLISFKPLINANGR